jgi:hypothetical protein
MPELAGGARGALDAVPLLLVIGVHDPLLSLWVEVTGGGVPCIAGSEQGVGPSGAVVRVETAALGVVAFDVHVLGLATAVVFEAVCLVVRGLAELALEANPLHNTTGVDATQDAILTVGALLRTISIVGEVLARGVTSGDPCSRIASIRAPIGARYSALACGTGAERLLVVAPIARALAFVVLVLADWTIQAPIRPHARQALGLVLAHWAFETATAVGGVMLVVVRESVDTTHDSVLADGAGAALLAVALVVVPTALAVLATLAPHVHAAARLAEAAGAAPCGLAIQPGDR